MARAEASRFMEEAKEIIREKARLKASFYSGEGNPEWK